MAPHDTPPADPAAPLPHEAAQPFATPSYVLPDDEPLGLWTRTRHWIQEHPVLAVGLAAGMGLVLGRLMTTAVHPHAPSPSAFREAFSDALESARDTLEAAAETVAARVSEGAEQTHDFADRVGEAVKAALRKD